MKQVLFFSSMIAVLLLGSFSAVLADETIVVRGQVGDVIVGPSSEDTSDDDNEESSSDAEKEEAPILPAADATVSIEPIGEQGTGVGMVGGIPQFTTSKPSFQGTTNIQNADISLIFSFGNMSFRAFFKANADGTWRWLSSEDFPKGQFQVTVTAVHPTEASIRAETVAQFSVMATPTATPWTEQYRDAPLKDPFELRLDIQNEDKTLVPGANLVALIQLLNFSTKGNSEKILVEYNILNEAGNKILEQQETVEGDNNLVYSKVFYTQADMRPGTYTLLIKVPSRNTLAVASEEFIIKGKKELHLSAFVKADYTTVILTGSATLFTFTLLSYFEFIRFQGVKKSIHFVTAKLLKRFF